MKQLKATLVLAVALFLGGCGGSDYEAAEAVNREIMKNMQAMGDVMGSITDEASAKAAVPKLGEIRASMRDAANRAKGVKINAADEKALEAKIGAERAKVMQSFMQSRAKLDAVLEKNPELMDIIGPALDGMENDMKGV